MFNNGRSDFEKNSSVIIVWRKYSSKDFKNPDVWNKAVKRKSKQKPR